MAVGPIVLGFVIESYGFQAAFHMNAAVIGVGGLISVLLMVLSSRAKASEA